MRALGATLASGALALGLSGPSHAESLAVDREGWAWRAQTASEPSLQPISGIEDDQLPVSRMGAEPDKISYLHFELPEGAVSESLSVRIEVETDASANVAVEDAAIVSCLVTESWSGGANREWSARPETDCTDAVEGTFDADEGTFEFDLTPLLATLTGPYNHGISLEPSPDSSGAFQVVFRGSEQDGVRVDVAAAPPATDDSGTVTTAPNVGAGNGVRPPLRGDIGARPSTPGVADGSAGGGLRDAEGPAQGEAPASESATPQGAAGGGPDGEASLGAVTGVRQEGVTLRWVAAAILGLALLPLLGRLLVEFRPVMRANVEDTFRT